jgi:S1-C subfamily serine protease
MRIARKLGGLLLLITTGLCFELHVTAQTAPKQAPTTQNSQQKKRARTTAAAQQVIVDDNAAAPQVVTLLHRLSGLKMFRLLLRSGEVGAIARLDDEFEITGNVHTNVIAGLAMDDGETIAAWLPEVSAEIAPPSGARSQVTPAPSAGSAAAPTVHGFGNWFQSPNLTVIARDRRRLSARYVGLDGVTGLSVLKLPQKSLLGEAATNFVKEESLSVGQAVRLFGPEPAVESPTATTSPVYVRVGETKGLITKITRSPSGSIARVEIRSPKVSAANIGGVAINDAGETLGIVASVKGTEASIVPATLIRNAAKRVLARQASVPRPWLGVRGEPLGSFANDQLLRNGWEPSMVESLVAGHYGILLTSVAPGSPASKASLRPGDVILRVNDGEVKGGDHFTWLIEEAGSGGNLVFTVARRDKPTREAVEVKLGEAPSPLFGLSAPLLPAGVQEWKSGFEPSVMAFTVPNTLFANGLETIALRPLVAARLGSNGGLLVIDVLPATPAYKAGLRPGDVIETINGKRLSPTTESIKLTNTPGEVYTFSVVRNKQRLEISFVLPDAKK